MIGSNLLVDVLELELEFALLLVTLAHHVLEIDFKLDHLAVKTRKLLVLSFGRRVHLVTVFIKIKLC